MGVEGHRVVVNLVFDALSGGGHLVVGRLTAVVRQFVGLEEAALVGHDILYKRLLVAHDMVDGYADVGSARAVVEAYVAFHAAGVLTLAHLHLCLGRGDAFAVVHGQHLIFVCNQRRHGLVLVAHLVQVGGHFLPSIVALALHAAHHLEVVDGLAVGVPGQQHAALARRRHQRRVNRTRVFVVEQALQIRVGDGPVFLVRLRRGLRIDGVAFLHPRTAEFRQQVVQRGFRNYRSRLHLRNGLAVDKMPCTGLLAVHQTDHFTLVGLVVMIDSPVTPFGTGNGKTSIIGSPGKSITIVIYTEPYYFGLGTSGWITVDTVHRPTASISSPSDDTSYIRTVSIVSLYRSVKETVGHINICIICMTDVTAGMGACTGHLCRYPHMIKGDGGGTTSSTANESGRMYTTFDCSRYMQVGDSDITNLGEEGCKTVTATIDIDSDCVSVTV